STRQERLGRPRPYRRHADRAERDPRRAAALAVRLQAHGRGDGDGRVVVRGPRKELHVGGAARRGKRWDDDTGDDLAGLDRALVAVADEPLEGPLTSAGGAAALHAGPAPEP